MKKLFHIPQRPGERIKRLVLPAQGSKDYNYQAADYLAHIYENVKSTANKIWNLDPNKHPGLDWKAAQGEKAKDKQAALCDAIVDKANAIHSAFLKVPKTATPPVDKIKHLKGEVGKKLVEPVNKALKSEENLKSTPPTDLGGEDYPLDMAEYGRVFCTFLDGVLAEVKEWQGK